MLKSSLKCKKGSFAQQLRKAAQTVGIDIKPGLCCTVVLHNVPSAAKTSYERMITQPNTVCQGKISRAKKVHSKAPPLACTTPGCVIY